MTPRQYSGRFRAGFAFAVSITIPALCTAHRGPQPDPTKAAPPSVYSNPRSGPDDPRIGLKPGLFDAGEAIFGLQKIATLQKPPGFAPDPNAPEPTSTPALSTPTSPLSVTISSWGTITASTSTTSITPPRSSSALRSSVPADRATSPSTATCSSCRPKL